MHALTWKLDPNPTTRRPPNISHPPLVAVWMIPPAMISRAPLAMVARRPNLSATQGAGKIPIRPPKGYAALMRPAHQTRDSKD